MLELSKLRAMEDALSAHAAYVAALRAEYEKTSAWDVLSDTRERARAIWEEAAANHERFKSRRSDLVEQDPSDHEAVAAFVSSVRRIAGSPLPLLVAKERESNATANIVGGAVADTARQAGELVKLGLPVLALVAAAYIVSKVTK